MTFDRTPGIAQGLTSALVARLPQLLDDVRAGVAAVSAGYARFLDAERAEVTSVAEEAIRELIAAAITPGDGGDGIPPLTGLRADIFELIGREHFRAGRDVAGLLSAYQVGARTAWSRLAPAALELGAGPSVVTELAKVLFGFVDQLSTASLRGYVSEQSESVTERERLRRELAARLLRSCWSSRTTSTVPRSSTGWAVWCSALGGGTGTW